MSWARWRSVMGVVLLGMVFGACDNVTVVLEEVPANTPSDAAIYVAGNFNFWDPGDPAYRMKQGPDGRYTVDLPKGSGIVKFKFTRGDWTTVEGDECAKVLLDREVALGFQDTVFAVVQSWEDLQPLNCSR
ncbi:MAG: hypothetical protein AAGB22_15890, partial [Bacteroidota bacterium]